MLAELRWLGLTWDEGPDVGGPFGPYRQSERVDLYTRATRSLLERGQAYYCFCSPAELERAREEALRQGTPPRYSGRCRGIDPAEAAARVARGEPAAIRFAVPPGARDISFRDVVRGEVSVSSLVVGDFVLVRSGGLPAYNFAVVVDDAAMGIELVIRGEDHISNTDRKSVV